MKKLRAKLILIAVLCLAALIAPCTAYAAPCPKDLEQPRFSGFQVYEENDSILLKDGGDERYTQGLRFAVSYHRDRRPCWSRGINALLKKMAPKADLTHSGFALLLGQTEYTPLSITSHVLEPNDRGFADYTFIGGQWSETADDDSVRHIFEFTLGAVDSPGLGRATQGGLHTLKMSRVPKGWNVGRTTKPGFNGHYRMEWRPLCRESENCLFDITAGHAEELGSVRISAGAHAALRLGWRITGFPAATIPGALRDGGRSSFEFAATFGVEGRALGHTALVKETPGTTNFSTERLVGDLRWGGYVRYRSVRASLQHVRRSAEFSIKGLKKRSQDFSTISVSYEPESLTVSEGHRPWHWRDWQIELGMGSSFNNPKLTVGHEWGIATQASLRKSLGKGFTLGLFELSAITGEGLPIPNEPENRSDVFLRQRSATLGWMREGKAGSFGVRAGSAIYGGDARIQTITHPRLNGAPIESKQNRDFKAPRGGWMVGAQYLAPLERHLTIGVDVAYHHVRLGESVPNLVKPTFVKALLVVRVRP